MIVASMVACAQIRKLTYPPDFTYLEQSEVESLMRQMGEGIARLDQLIAEASKSDVAQQQQIIAELSELEKIATRLSGGHTQTNQIVINDHIEQFITDLGTAKMFAKISPPNYNKAEQIGSSCHECHQFR
jgi:hypothetical protein